jgi:hypothetical protein
MNGRVFCNSLQKLPADFCPRFAMPDKMLYGSKAAYGLCPHFTAFEP